LFYFKPFFILHLTLSEIPALFASL
jgi:hypothetical protein